MSGVSDLNAAVTSVASAVTALVSEVQAVVTALQAGSITDAQAEALAQTLNTSAQAAQAEVTTLQAIVPPAQPAS